VEGRPSRRRIRRREGVFISGQKRGVFGIIKRELRRRSAIEPLIGHMKEEGHLGRLRRVVAAVSLVDIGPFDVASGEALGVLDGGRQSVPVVGIARQRWKE
jgi:hypothetical protein